MGWKGWARPPSRPEAGPRSSPGLCWWPRGALQAGGRGIRLHRDALAGACGKKAGEGLATGAGRATLTHTPPALRTPPGPRP